MVEEEEKNTSLHLPSSLHESHSEEVAGPGRYHRSTASAFPAAEQDREIGKVSH